MKNEDYRQITFNVDKARFEKARAYAKDYGLSVAVIFRLAIAEGLDKVCDRLTNLDWIK